MSTYITSRRRSASELSPPTIVKTTEALLGSYLTVLLAGFPWTNLRRKNGRSGINAPSVLKIYYTVCSNDNFCSFRKGAKSLRYELRFFNLKSRKIEIFMERDFITFFSTSTTARRNLDVFNFNLLKSKLMREKKERDLCVFKIR